MEAIIFFCVLTDMGIYSQLVFIGARIFKAQIMRHLSLTPFIIKRRGCLFFSFGKGSWWWYDARGPCAWPDPRKEVYCFSFLYLCRRYQNIALHVWSLISMIYHVVQSENNSKKNRTVSRRSPWHTHTTLPSRHRLRSLPWKFWFDSSSPLLLRFSQLGKFPFAGARGSYNINREAIMCVFPIGVHWRIYFWGRASLSLEVFF